MDEAVRDAHQVIQRQLRWRTESIGTWHVRSMRCPAPHKQGNQERYKPLCPSVDEVFVALSVLSRNENNKFLFLIQNSIRFTEFVE